MLQLKHTATTSGRGGKRKLINSCSTDALNSSDLNLCPMKKENTHKRSMTLHAEGLKKNKNKDYITLING